MFVGRVYELNELEKRYRMGGFQFPVIYGRRRIGKTRLIQEFIKDKQSVYFMATEQDAASLLRDCSRIVLETLGTGLARSFDSFASWQQLFEFIGLQAQARQLVFVIDEYPYLARAYPAISSILQSYIDHQWSSTQLYLILCGSSMSFMEEQILGYQSPLYGRRTCQLKLSPLNYLESSRFFPSWSFEEQLYAYGICDGTPQYLQFLSRYRNLKEAVCEELLSVGGHLREEPQNILKQELREPLFYYQIITAIAEGANKLNEIASAVQKESSRITPYLSTLSSLQLVEKVHPVEDSSPRHVLYRLSDLMFSFWFRFIPRCSSLIEMGLGEEAWDHQIAPLLNDYYGHIFEQVCMQYLKREVVLRHIPELYTEYGSWWGGNPHTRQQEDIDLVLTNATDILVGECKWKSDPVSWPVFETLQRRAALISKGRQIHYAIFSKNGFTDDFRRKADKKILLIEPEMMLKGT